MDGFRFILNGIEARIDDALIALTIIIVLQCFMVAVSHFLKRPFTPLPLLELILRPLGVFLIDKLNRANRSDLSLIIRGIIVFAIMAVSAIALGMVGEYLLYILGYGGVMDIILLLFVLSPVYPAYIGFKASKANPPKKTFYFMAQGLNQNLVATDDAGQRRNGYRLMALALGEWVVAPITLYLIGGMGIAYAYAALSLFCRVAGFSQMFLSIMGFVHSLIKMLFSSICLIVIFLASIFAAGGRPLSVLKAFSYVGEGKAVEAAYAYAQNTILGGAIQDRNGQGVKQPWIGRNGASAKLTHQDVIRGCFMHFIAVFLIWSLLLVGQIYL